MHEVIEFDQAVLGPLVFVEVREGEAFVEC